MTTPIKQLKDESSADFYPQTVKAAISDYDASSIEVTSVDPGEGATLEEGKFIAVTGYEPVTIIKAGNVNLGSVPANSAKFATVSFPTQPSYDKIYAQITHSAQNAYFANCMPVFADRTTSSIKVGVYNNAGSATGDVWLTYLIIRNNE